MAMQEKLIIVGRNEPVDLLRYARRRVPAKIDTGADSSSIWVSNVRVDKDGILKFSLFGEGSPFYNGKTVKREKYRVAWVRSASGHLQLRYRTQLTLQLGGRRIRATFNLSDRSQNKFPILIGRRTLSGKFLVDVSKASYTDPNKFSTTKLNDDLRKNPYEFYKKHYKISGVSMKEKS